MFRQIKQAYSAAELWQDGQQPVVYVPQVPIRSQGRTIVRDVLLWPAARDGYESRFFLSDAVQAPKAANWKVYSIAGRKWHACSWKGVAASLPWLDMILAHLRAFA